MFKRYFVVFTNGNWFELREEKEYKDCKSWLKTDRSTFLINEMDNIWVLHRNEIRSCEVRELRETREQEQKRIQIQNQTNKEELELKKKGGVWKLW